MSDKTLVEMLREVNYGHASHTHCQIADALGIRCEGKTCDECGENMAHALADAIEREYMPRPRFSNNEPMHFGDWFTAETYGIKEPEQLKRLCIFSPELLREWEQDDGEKFAFEFNYMRPADLDFRLDKCEKPEPESLERIEDDALMASIDYCNKYGLLDSECNAEEGDEAVRHCTDCGLTCETRMVKHILRRQREVMERDHER